MSRLPVAADRLATGSTLLTRRIANRAAAWVRAGRRRDLTGWKAVLGCWFRIALLAGAAYMAARALRAVPALLWVLGAVWVVAAWRAAPRPAKTLPEAAEEPSAEPDPDAVRQLIADLIGDRPGVHLSTVLAHLPGEGRTVADLRDRLPALGVPVRRSVKVAGKVAYGVHRDDLPAPSPATERADAA